MSLKYGLNVKKTAPPPRARQLLDDDDGDDADDLDGAAQDAPAPDSARSKALRSLGHKPSMLTPPARPRGMPKRLDDEENEEHDGIDQRPSSTAVPHQDLSSLRTSQTHIQGAEAADPGIFDYDSFYDAKARVSEAKKAAERQDARERKPKYIHNLLESAARRKQDQTVAREKFLQKEREAEGDEFADKEKFVTGAYKAQQEENRRLEEEERQRSEADEQRRRREGGGMQGFYRGMIDLQARQHQEAIDAAAEFEREGGAKDSSADEEGSQLKTDAQMAAELRAKGVNVHLNDDGQVTDKRELLTAGLNVAPSGRLKDARRDDDIRSHARPAQSASASRNDGGKAAQRERQSRMMEEQLAAQAKRARDEEVEEGAKLEKAAKSSKTEKDVSDAKARFLARKAAREKGDG